MKESIGYSVTIKIVIVFVIIIFAFLSAALIYFKSNKVSSMITSTIEKHSGYNDISKNEISARLTSIGYNKKKLNSCNDIEGCKLLDHNEDGYCVYLCVEPAGSAENCEDYYYYKIKTNMMLSMPIINDVLDVPIFSNTNRLYNFEKDKCEG